MDNITMSSRLATALAAYNVHDLNDLKIARMAGQCEQWHGVGKMTLGEIDEILAANNDAKPPSFSAVEQQAREICKASENRPMVSKNAYWNRARENLNAADLRMLNGVIRALNIANGIDETLGAVATALYDTFNTARLTEHLEEVPAYQQHARTFMHWLEAQGYRVVHDGE